MSKSKTSKVIDSDSESEEEITITEAKKKTSKVEKKEPKKDLKKKPTDSDNDEASDNEPQDIVKKTKTVEKKKPAADSDDDTSKTKNVKKVDKKKQATNDSDSDNDNVPEPPKKKELTKATNDSENKPVKKATASVEPADKQTAKADAVSPKKPSEGNIPIVYKYKEVNFNNFEVPSYEKLNKTTDKKSKQLGCPLNYVNPNTNITSTLYVQTDYINIKDGGIPRIGEFAEKDSDREFIKVPMDNTKDGEKSGKELNNFLQAGDEIFGSDEFKIAVFGESLASKYSYSPMISHPLPEDPNAENKSKYPKFDKCKMRFGFSHIDPNDRNSEKFLSTHIFKNSGPKPELMNLKTMTEVFNEITFKSDVRFIFTFNRFWIAKNPIGRSTTKLYGVTLKIFKVYYKPSLNGSKKPSAEELAFRDDPEEESEDVQKKSVKKSTKFDDSDEEPEPENKKSKSKSKHASRD